MPQHRSYRLSARLLVTFALIMEETKITSIYVTYPESQLSLGNRCPGREPDWPQQEGKGIPVPHSFEGTLKSFWFTQVFPSCSIHIMLKLRIPAQKTKTASVLECIRSTCDLTYTAVEELLCLRGCSAEQPPSWADGRRPDVPRAEGQGQ